MGNCFGKEKKDYQTFDSNEDAFTDTVEELSRDVFRGSQQQRIEAQRTEVLQTQSVSSVKNINNSTPSLYEEKTTDFPFLQDSKTILYIKVSKTLFIMRGPPGCGKSTIVKLIENTYKGTCSVAFCSADNYFMKDDGKYHFDINCLPYAHQDCKDKATAACQEDRNIVVIDNTNIRRWEMQPYIEMANNNGYVVVLVAPRTSWKNDAEILSQRTLHDVKAEDIRKKISHFESFNPIYYGWFLNSDDSCRIRTIAKQCLIQCVRNIPEMASVMFPGAFSDLSDDHILAHFNIRNTDSNKRLHCTAKYMGTRKNPAQGRTEYQNRQNVDRSCGKVFTTKITGLTITPRTLGARVSLSEGQLQLYDKPEEEQRVGNLKMGRAAHLTIASAYNVRPVQTNFDLLDICDIEARNEASVTMLKTYPVTGGVLKYLGEDFCAVYFESAMFVDSLFSGLY